jgi:uncharacterized protein YbjT (DUF2867 family)
MLLLTGATGLVGSAALRRLTGRGEPVRCLVRDPRRLGPERVRVQIALGDLGDPQSFRHALRGVSTVVHLAASGRDQPHATIEELDALSTWRLLRASERAGVEHFVFLTPLGATPYHPARMQRAESLAGEAVADAAIRTTTLAVSLAYAPRDRRLRLTTRLSYLPVLPVPRMGHALSQPIWADDVADCLVAALDAPNSGHVRYELAGPDAFSHPQIIALILRAAGHRRRLVPLPDSLLRPAMHAYEVLAGPGAFITWDEAQLLSASLVSERGTADAEALGVRPQPLPAVLGLV